MSTQPVVDAVIVAYNSADTLRGGVEPLSAMPDVRTVVVDNACPTDSTATVADLPITLVRAGRNGGFAAGCNVGIATGSAPYVLLLNPDARLSHEDVEALVAVLEHDPRAGLAAPRILDADGELEYSLRRFPRRRSTYAQALFLHRIWPKATWTDELVRDPAAYERPHSPEWVSGACMLIRREALEAVGGLDESYFLYCEDIDICARLREHGWDVRYEPTATVHHVGGASHPREELIALQAANRVRYARKHASRAAVPFEALGVALGHLTHAVASITRPKLLRGHLRALAAVIRPQEVR
jgi:GT2 family glycosyltransferase